MLMEVHINGKEVHLELDTGSAYTLINEETRKRLRISTTPLHNCKLRAYNQGDVEVKGQAQVHVEWKGKKLQLSLIVVKQGDIMGRDWFSKLGFNVVNAFHAATIFEQDAKPQFRKPRQVPYALLPLVEEALDDMEQQGIITKIEHSEWATPIVSIKKPNGKVRICGDYKDTGAPTPPMASPRMIRWCELLSAYDYDLQHRPGKHMGNVDALSRLPLPTQDIGMTKMIDIALLENAPEWNIDAFIVAQQTKKDPTLSRVLRWVTHGWPDLRKETVPAILSPTR
ncbi:hypothetical protein DMN91_003099 [Ooceraea biroi]|uniref:Peptidase A2 domain-containing protein n=1 Tax=Ooceraea biroi TaxID=2015173 RepID=A0A3L8DX40_OOCBI|nr:hypothetical protein DMN91_003099 [Ooceraea biroi]